MKTLILISTFSRMEKYSLAIEAAVDHCWPEHPAIYFISDNELPGIARQIQLADARWTDILLHGLLTLRKQHPAVDYVFLMLDDHCPLRPCDARALSGYLAIARAGNLPVISFPTFEWPWNETASTEYPDGLVRAWRKIEIEVVDGRRLAPVPRDFFRYFQLQPAFWSTEYLISVCEAALENGVGDPWTFEAMRLDDTRQHYVADYNWPSVHHGFIAAGKINPAAISYMSKKAVPELRRKLIREVIGVDNATIYCLYRLGRRGTGLLRRVRKALSGAFSQLFALMFGQAAMKSGSAEYAGGPMDGESRTNSL